MGKPIPAGTGLLRYRKTGLTYKGVPVKKEDGNQLPDYAPEMLTEIEELLPKQEEWQVDEDGYLSSGSGLSSFLNGYGSFGRRIQLSEEEGRLYIFDDLGVSQRWANKFSEAGIETVSDLVGRTEEDLLRIEGIGSKAIEELEDGLKARDLMYVIENDLTASKDDMSQLLDMVFSPDDTILLGGDTLPTYDYSDEDMLGEALPPRTYRRNPEELDALLGGLNSLSSMGFDFTDDQSAEDESSSTQDDEQ